MAIENLPMFTAMNREEVKPPFPPPCKPPMTSQEAHFAIMEKVNACINEVNNFEQRVRFEMEQFISRTETENTGFKEAIQASYNAFMQTVQQEVNNFETDMQNNFDLYRNDVDKRFADFQTAIENDFVTLQTSIFEATNKKIGELEELRVTMNNEFTKHRTEVQALYNSFTTQVTQHITEQDRKIEDYKQYMVDNLPENVENVFEQKAANGEITELMKEVYGDSRRFMGSGTYAEITGVSDAVNGDYYYCTDDDHYYQRTATAWVDIGTGDNVLNNLLAFQTHMTEKTENIHRFLYDDIFGENKVYASVDDIRYVHDGISKNKYAVVDIPTLEQGEYVFYAPKNTFYNISIRGYINGSSAFVFEPNISISGPVVEPVKFVVNKDCEYFKILYFASRESYLGEAKTYTSGKQYIYKAGDFPTIPLYLLNIDSTAKINTTDYIGFHHKDLIPTVKRHYNPNFNGDTYHGYLIAGKQLESGDYTLVSPYTNAIRIIVQNADGVRIVDYLNRNGVTGKLDFNVAEEFSNNDFLIYYYATIDETVDPFEFIIEKPYLFKKSDYEIIPDFLTGVDKLKKDVSSLQLNVQENKEGFLKNSVDNLLSGETLQIQKLCNVKKHSTLTFTGFFESFEGLEVAHGKGSYGGMYVEITPTHLNVYNFYSSGSLVTSVEHGLTITDFITVNIHKDVTRGFVNIMTASGSFKVDELAIDGCNGYLTATNNGDTMQDCELTFTASDIYKNLWVFGDSYVSFGGERWAGVMNNMGYSNYLLSGYPGGSASAELACFKTLLSMAKPKVACWCLGMNNGDNGAINETWLSCTNTFLQLCDENGIEPVLATIPSCPKVDNTYKNEWVRASGRRYVDFNKAVGVEGTSWYEGMLSSDNVHPSALGANALANRVLIDLPEITL